MSFINRLKAVFDTSADENSRDSGALLISHLIMIAGFAIMSLLVVNWLSTAVLNKAADDAKCVEESNNYAKSTMTAAACSDSTQTSFTDRSDYTGRDMQD
jgi:hypothetical protein